MVWSLPPLVVVALIHPFASGLSLLKADAQL